MMHRYPFSFFVFLHRLLKERLRCVLVAFLLCFCLVQTGQTAGKEQPIQIAIPPCTDIMRTFKEYQPLVAYLKQQIGQPVSLVIPKDFSEFERVVKEGTVDFTFQAPHTYVRLAHLYNREMLLKALTPEGETKHRGVVIVREDSPLQRIEDLKGKYVIFGAENDMAKSLSAKRLLTAKGINPEKDLRSYKYDGSCESIALNVFLKTADAGVVCDYSFKKINEPGEVDKGEIPANQLRVIGQTEEVPTWIFAARKEVDPDLVARINKALIVLSPNNKEHEEVLESAEIRGFVKAKDSDYDEVRKIVPMVH